MALRFAGNAPCRVTWRNHFSDDQAGRTTIRIDCTRHRRPTRSLRPSSQRSSDAAGWIATLIHGSLSRTCRETWLAPLHHRPKPDQINYRPFSLLDEVRSWVHRDTESSLGSIMRRLRNSRSVIQNVIWYAEAVCTYGLLSHRSLCSA
jgi:hypothetical protein